MRPTATVGSFISRAPESVDDLNRGVVDPGAHAGGLHDRSDRAGGAAAPADHLAHVVGAHAEGEDHPPVVLRLLDLNGVGLVHELANQVVEEVTHLRTPWRPWLLPSSSASGAARH